MPKITSEILFHQRKMTRAPKSNDELWNIVAESSFEVVLESLKQISGKKSNLQQSLIESQAATSALQELSNRAMGLKPETLRE